MTGEKNPEIQENHLVPADAHRVTGAQQSWAGWGGGLRLWGHTPAISCSRSTCGCCSGSACSTRNPAAGGAWGQVCGKAEVAHGGAGAPSPVNMGAAARTSSKVLLK